MELLRQFLRALQDHGLLAGRFRGLLHILIGRRVVQTDGTVVSTGMTWREAAELLRALRWDREAVRELGLDPATLAPRDRQRYWFQAITHANVNGAEARVQAEEIIAATEALGYTIGDAPGA